MVSSRALPRMRAAHPDGFEPKTIFFSTSPIDHDLDWASCFNLKAISVYSVITGKVDEETPYKASMLLICIAKNYLSHIASVEAKDSIKETAPTKTQIASMKAADSTKDTTQTATTQVASTKAERVLTVNASPSKDANDERLSEDPHEVPLEDLPPEMKEAIDGVYLVVGFLQDLKRNLVNWDREKLNAHYLSMHLEDAVADIIKIENQLPLDLLMAITKHLKEVLTKTKDYLLKKKAIQVKDDLFSSIEKFNLSFTVETFHEIVHLFCWYYSPFYSSKGGANPNEDIRKKLPSMKHLLECLHYSLLLKADHSYSYGEELSSSRLLQPIPTARQLARSGVRFEANNDNDNDKQIRFSDPVLYIPALVDDFKLETVVRNLLAWECLHWEHGKPVTRYFQLLNELVEEVGDVGVLKRFGIIKGGWRKEEEVMDLVNRRIDGFPSQPSMFPAIDKEIDKLKEFHDRRMKKFLVRNQPTVIWFSSMAAVSLLVAAVFAANKRRR